MNASVRTTYLDHAATTPMVPEAIAVMAEELARTGNASSLHASGRAARRTVEEARELIAERFGARPSEVVFCSGGTEANNLAIKGLYWSRLAQDPARNRIVFSSIEHHALLDPVTWLAKHEGAEIDMTPVDDAGRILIDDLRASVEADPSRVAAITTMWANNEMGTVQPIAEVVDIARASRHPRAQRCGAGRRLPAARLHRQRSRRHDDHGAQARRTRRCRRAADPPRDRGDPAAARRRPGARPALRHDRCRADRGVRQGGRRHGRSAGRDGRPASNGFVSGSSTASCSVVPDAIVNGDPLPGPDHRLPNIAHVTFPGCEGDAMLMLLDAQGIECSTGSACDAGVPQPSHVLLAMGYDDVAARGSLRFSLGHTSTEADVDALIAALPAVHERAKRAHLVRTSS